MFDVVRLDRLAIDSILVKGIRVKPLYILNDFHFPVLTSPKILSYCLIFFFDVFISTPEKENITKAEPTIIKPPEIKYFKKNNPNPVIKNK